MTQARAWGVLLLWCGLSVGCRAQPRFVWVHELPAEAQGDEAIETGDTLLVEVKDQPTATGEYPVREDGQFLQPAIGSVKVQGLTPSQASALLTSRLRGAFVNPVAQVWIVRRPPIRVSVIGEVKTPGSLELGRHRNVMAALAGAGWLTEFASGDKIYVIRNADHRRIRFSLRDLTAPEPRSALFRLRDGDVVVAE